MERLRRTFCLMAIYLLTIGLGLVGCYPEEKIKEPTLIIEEALETEQVFTETATDIPSHTSTPTISLTTSIEEKGECHFQKIYQSDILFYDHFRADDQIFFRDRENSHWYIFNEETNSIEVVSETVDAIQIFQSQQLYIQAVREQGSVGAYKFFDNEKVIYSFLDEGSNKTAVEIYIDNMGDDSPSELIIDVQGVIDKFFWLDQENVIFSMEWHVSAERTPENYVYLVNITEKKIVPVVEKGKPYFDIDLGGIIGNELLLSSMHEQNLLVLKLDNLENSITVLPVKATFTFDVLEDDRLLLTTKYENGKATIVTMDLPLRQKVCEFQVATESRIYGLFVLKDKILMLSENGVLSIYK
jgi:hypothetical protein